jgi:Mannosyltransferase (PIG-V)
VRLLGHPAMTFVLIRVGFLLGTALTLVWVIPSNTAVLAFGAYGRVSDYVFGAFAQWDSDWYLGIAENGYTEESAAFFPLFPGVVYVVGWVLGSNLVAGVLVSLAGAAVGAWALHQIARTVIGEEAARDTVLLLALYPTAFVFTAAYSEGLFLAFATTSFLAAQRGRPWTAGVLAGLAVATRLMGLALIPALIVLLWPKTRSQIPQLAPVVLFPLMGLAAVALTFDLALDDALAFSHAQVFWDRDPSWFGPLSGIYHALAAVPDSLEALISVPDRVRVVGEPASMIDQLRMQNAQLGIWNLVDLLALAGAVALTVVAWRRLGLAFALYSAAFLAIATSAPGASIVLNSMVRFVMVDFPVLMAGATLISGRPQLRTGVLVTLGGLSAVAGATFARKLWVA